MRCLSCKYDLSRLSKRRCPERGRAFDPNDRRTFAETAHSGARLRFLVILWIPAFVTGYLLSSRYFLPGGMLEIAATGVAAFVFATLMTGMLWLLF